MIKSPEFYCNLHTAVEELEVFIQAQENNLTSDSRKKAYSAALEVLQDSQWLKYHYELSFPLQAIAKMYRKMLWLNWVDTITVLTFDGSIFKGFINSCTEENFTFSPELASGQLTFEYSKVRCMYYTLALHRGPWWKENILLEAYVVDLEETYSNMNKITIPNDIPSLAKKYYLHCRLKGLLGVSILFKDLSVTVTTSDADVENPEVADFIIVIEETDSKIVEKWSFSFLPSISPVCILGGNEHLLLDILAAITSDF